MGSKVNERRTSVMPGERAFRLVSGHRALDLLATLRDRHRDPVEYLCEPADLDRWLALAGLRTDLRASEEDLAGARRVRETVNRLVRAILAQQRPIAADLRELNERARRPPLAPQAGPGLELRWTGSVDAALASLAREAVVLLTGPERALIRECAAVPNCSRVYLDRSPGRRRRWCQMEWCGSSAKMRSYRRRRREEGSTRPQGPDP